MINPLFIYTVTIILFLGVVVLLGYILIRRVYLKIRHIRVDLHKDYYQDLLTQFLFDENWQMGSLAYHTNIAVLKNYVNKTSLSRQVFVDELFELHQNLLGDSRHDLIEIYHAMELSGNLSKRLNFFTGVEEKLRLIKEITLLQLFEHEYLIEKLLEDRDEVVRSHAQIALLQLKGTEALTFIPMIKGGLPEWQQISILEYLKNVQFSGIPDFWPWLRQGEPSVEWFALRLIAYFNQVEAIPYILDRLKDADEIMKIRIMKTLAGLQAFGTQEVILSHYSDSSGSLKREILKTLLEIGDDELLPFYIEQLARDEHELVIQAVRCIQSIGSEGEEYLNNVMEDVPEKKQALIKHALDPQIT